MIIDPITDITTTYGDYDGEHHILLTAPAGDATTLRVKVCGHTPS